jgi:tetratricopeptide (TPR) repeat protein
VETDEPPPPTIPPPPTVQARRSTYVEAVALYQAAMEALQGRDFLRAADLLREVLQSFPDEKELLERTRVYLSFCERQVHPPSAEPQSIDERLYAATLALNAGEIDRALRYLNQVVEREPEHDRALYLLATAHAERGERDLALPYLKRAIEANPDNRALARSDPDLQTLRGDAAFVTLLETPAASRGDGKRPGLRQRPAR